MALDRLDLTDDTVGYSYHDPEHAYHFALLANDASAHGFSAGNQSLLGPMPAAGRVLDFQIAANPAVSASGFVSGTIDALLRLNSANIMTTNPSITMAGSASAVFPQLVVGTNVAQSASAAGIVFLVSGVVNGASASFKQGDYISIDWNARSVGSAAPTTSGKSLRAYVVVRYTAV